MRTAALILILCGASPQQKKGPPSPPSDVLVHAFQTIQDAQGRSMLSDWTTYSLDVENRSARDLSLTIRVWSDISNVRLTRREALAHGTRKRFFFYLPEGPASGWGSAVAYEILDAAGRRLAASNPSETRSSLEPEAYQIGLFTGDKSATGAFGFPAQVGRLDVGVFRLGPATFPDRWIALAGLDAILVHDAPLDELTPGQSRALSEYVRGGGTAILSPGADPRWLLHPAISAFVPIRLGTSKERSDLPALNASFGKFRALDRFVFHGIESGSPMGWGREILQFRCGLGQAIVLPFDLRRPPFEAWTGLDPFWTAMLGKLPRRFAPETSPHLPAATPEANATLLQSMALLVNPYPPFLLLVGLAVLFLVAVGPVNYIALRRMGMTILIVVTVPAISAAFLVLVFGIGYLLKGTSTVAYSMRILSTRPGADCARETQLYTLFSPGTRTYRVTMAPGTHGVPIDRYRFAERRRYRGADGSAPMLDVEDGAATAYPAVGVGQWQSWNLQARAFRDLAGGVHLESTGDRVKVTNLTPFTIRRGLVLESGEGGGTTPFGEVAAGKSTEVQVGPGHRRPYEDLGITRESFAGRMLAPTLDPLVSSYVRPADPLRSETGRSLLCILQEEEPPVRVDAGLSGDSRSLTILHVGEPATR